MQHSVLLTIKSFLAGALWLAASAAQAQNPDWQTAVALAGDVQVQASTTDANGNVYLAGGFAGSVTLGSTTLNTTNGQEIFVAKWNPNTGFAWAMQGTTGSTSGRNLATAITITSTSATTNAVFVAGNFVGPSLTLGTRAALPNAQNGTSDIFLARLLEVGSGISVSWAKRAGSTSNDYATSLSAYSSSYIYLGGSTGGSATFDSFTLPGAGGFVARYTGFNSTMPVSPAPVVRAGDNVTALQTFGTNVYAAGTFSNAAGTMPSGTLTSAGGEDVFALKLDYNDLNTQYWAQQAGGPGDDFARSLLVSNNSVYLSGSYRGTSAAFGSTTLTNTGAANLFVSKLTDAGSSASFAWALQNGGTSTTTLNSINALSLYGTSLFAAGEFGGTASFGSRTLSSAGSSDVVVAKITDAGTSASFVGAQQAGGAGADYAISLGRLDMRTWYTTGQVSTPAPFGTGFSIGTNAGARPGYVALLSDPAPLLTLAAPNTGLIGSTLTLLGQGLSGTTAITFAGSSNNVVTSGFTVNAAGTQISGVVVPAGAQSGLVNVTTANGTSNGLVAYTVLSSTNPAPEWQSARVISNASTVRWAAPAANGAVIVAGEFSGSITLGSTTLTSAGGIDVFVAKFNPATGTYAWAVRAGAGDNDDAYGGLAVSGSNIYLAGQFTTQSITFGSTTLTASQGTYNGYVAKLTDAGSSASFAWAQVLDDNSGVFVEALTANGNNIYVGGDYTGPSLTVGNRTVAGNASYDDGYVARLTDNGSTATCNWIKTVGSTDGSTINVFGLSASGSTVYLTAPLYGSVSLGSTTLTAVGYNSSSGSLGPNDIVVARLIDNGTSADFAGAVRAGGAGSEYPVGLTAGPAGTLYVSGRNGSAAWSGATVTGTGAGFVLKVVDNGGALSVGWVQLLNNLVYQTAVNGTGIYVSSALVGVETYNGTPLRSAGGSDGLVVRLTDNGSSPSISWARAAGGLGGDGFRALALSGGQVVVGGVVTPAAVFGSILVDSPIGIPSATLAVLNDPLLLATAPDRSRAQLALYPNPARTQVTVRLPAGTAAQPTLLDALGRAVRRYPAVSKTETTLDLRGVPAGVYVLRCGAASQRLIVE